MTILEVRPSTQVNPAPARGLTEKEKGEVQKDLRAPKKGPKRGLGRGKGPAREKRRSQGTRRGGASPQGQREAPPGRRAPPRAAGRLAERSSARALRAFRASRRARLLVLRVWVGRVEEWILRHANPSFGVDLLSPPKDTPTHRPYIEGI